MRPLANVLALVCVAFTFPATVELLAVSLAALVPRRRSPLPSSDATCEQIAIVVPAHDEESTIAVCIKSLQAAIEADGRSSVVVVADCCTDATAEVCEGLGVRVLVREHPRDRGKGFALRHAWQQLRSERVDALAVVDADATVDPNFVGEIRRHLANADAVQVRNLVGNADASVRTRLLALGLLAINVVRPLGRERLGFSAGLLGNGFAVRREALEQVPFLGGSITEDLEHHIRFVQAGRRARFVNSTTVWSDAATGGGAAASQRVRWEGGRLNLVRNWAPCLVREIARGKLRLVEPLLDLLTPPLTYHASLLALLAVVPWAPARMWAAFGLAVLALHVTLAARLGGRLSDVTVLAAVPAYALWKLALLGRIVASGRVDAAWTRTPRQLEESSEWRRRLVERWSSTVTQGVLWTSGGYGASQALRLANNLILTRLLYPQAFGLMAIVDTLLIGLQMVSDTGIVQTLVQRKDPPDRDLLNTAWSIHAVRGVVLFGALALAARPIASWYAEPLLAPLLTVSAVGLIFEGLQSTGKFVAAREIALRRLVVFDLQVQVVGIAIALTCAWLYHSVWALVAGQLLSGGVALVASHAMFPVRGTRFAWTRDYARELVQFGRWLLPSTVLLFIVMRSDRLLVGKGLSVAELGAYNIACFVPLFVVAVVGQVSQNVLFPVFSRLGVNAPSQLRLQIERKRKIFLLFAVPLLSIVAVFGDFLVAALYDQRYQEAGWMLRALACGGIFSCANENALPVLLALGDPYRRFVVLLGSAVLFVTSVALGGALLGDVGLVAGVAAAPALAYPLMSWALGIHGVWTAKVDLLAFSGGAAAIALLETLRRMVAG